MSLTTKLRKLRKMSAKEICFRFGEKLRTSSERKQYNRRTSNTLNHSGYVKKFHDVYSRFLPGATKEQIGTIRESSPDFYRYISDGAVTRAELVLSGAYPLLSQPVDLRGEIEWHRCPVTRHSWPKVFYADVSTEQNSDNDLDVKFTWELGRQQYVVELAKGWFFSKDEKFACRALEQITDWIESNPLYEGVHWVSALEPSMRVISWIWCLAFLNDYDGIADRHTDMIVSSLHDHGIYLENHLSYYSSPYNHLIGEATALFLLGTLFGQSDDGIRWQSLGRDILEEHGSWQFYSDGFCVEQATGYHYYTLGFLTQAICVARQLGEPLKQLEEVTKKAYRTGKMFQRTDGLWPAIGDVDYARSIPILHQEFFDFDSMNSLGAALFSDSLLKTNTEFCGEELYWLMGTEGVETWNGLDVGVKQHVTTLADSGYFIASDEKDWLCFDAGPLAEGLHANSTPSTAHGHLDTLQVLFCFGGNSVLDDFGMPYYFGSKDIVRYARGASAHNTISIEGYPLAREAGRLAWASVAPRPRLHSESTEEFWNASAYLELSETVSIERHLLAIPGEGIWIADRIQTDIPRKITWTWQLPQIRKNEITQNEMQLVWNEEMEFQIDSPHSHCRLTINEYATDAANHCYGKPFRGCTITLEADCEDSLLLLTSIGSKDRREVNVRHLNDDFDVGEIKNANSSDSHRFQTMEWNIRIDESSSIVESVS